VKRRFSNDFATIKEARRFFERAPDALNKFIPKKELHELIKVMAGTNKLPKGKRLKYFKCKVALELMRYDKDNSQDA